MFFVEYLKEYRQENKNYLLPKDLKEISYNIFCSVSQNTFYVYIKTVYLQNGTIYCFIFCLFSPNTL